MIAEGIQALTELIRGGTRVNEIGKDGPRHRLFDVGGQLERRETVPKSRDHSVNTFESLVSVVQRNSVYGDFGHNATVWISHGMIETVLDDKVKEDGTPDHRLDRVALELTPNPLFNVLGQLSSMNHKQLIRLLDHTFSDASIVPAELLTAVRLVKWSTTDEEKSELQTTKNNMGRAIKNAVEGTEDLADRVSLEFKPYPALSGELLTEVLVECSFYVNTDERTFELKPLPGELERAKVTAPDRDWETRSARSSVPSTAF